MASQLPPAGSMPVDEATAASMGIKRGLRVDDLKLPPNKRTKSAATPGASGSTPTNTGSSPAAAVESSPPATKGESPKPVGAASPPASGRGGKRATGGAARGRGRKGKGAVAATGSDKKAEEASPRVKAKTSADIMAEVKAEIAAEAERKRKEEAEKAAAGIDDPSKNPINLAEEEEAGKRQQDEHLLDTDPGASVDKMWQELLASSENSAEGQNLSDGAGPEADPLRSIMAAVAQSPSAVANLPTGEQAQGSGEKSTGGEGALSGATDGSADADIFFDFESFYPGSSSANQGSDEAQPSGEDGDRSSSNGREGNGQTAGNGSQKANNELADALGLPSLTGSDDVPAETPELVSSSGVPSAASSSTSSSILLPPHKQPGMSNYPMSQLFDDSGYMMPRSASPSGRDEDSPEDPEHPTPAAPNSSLPNGKSVLKRGRGADSGLDGVGGVEGLSGMGIGLDAGANWWEADHFALYGSGSGGAATAGGDDKPWALLSQS